MAEPSETTRVSHEPDEPEAELVDAVRALSAQVGSLQADLQALRGEVPSLPAGEHDRPGWDDGIPVAREGPAWVRSVDSPRPRAVAVPWFLLETLFLVGVAVLAAVADFDPPVIAGLMVFAWVLVALAEWLASRASRDRYAAVYGAGTQFVAGVPDDRAWFASNGDDTLLDAPSGERMPARLPPAD